MEASPEVNTRMPANTFKMTVGLVSRLKGEINMFRSIYQLEKSPLLLQILSPKSFPLKKDSSSRGPFVYRGYVSYVLLHIKCLVTHRINS